MKKNRSSKRARSAPKTILRLPDLDHAKAAALNSLTCPDAQRGYRHAIAEFVDWYCSEPRQVVIARDNGARRAVSASLNVRGIIIIRRNRERIERPVGVPGQAA